MRCKQFWEGEGRGGEGRGGEGRGREGRGEGRGGEGRGGERREREQKRVWRDEQKVMQSLCLVEVVILKLIGHCIPIHPLQD